MSGWEKGDLALCVDDRPPRKKMHKQPNGEWRSENFSSSQLQKGALYRVGQVGPTVEYGIRGIAVEEIPHVAWLTTRFIKVTPPQDMIEQERREEVPA